MTPGLTEPSTSINRFPDRRLSADAQRRYAEMRLRMLEQAELVARPGLAESFAEEAPRDFPEQTELVAQARAIASRARLAMTAEYLLNAPRLTLGEENVGHPSLWRTEDGVALRLMNQRDRTCTDGRYQLVIDNAGERRTLDWPLLEDEHLQAGESLEVQRAVSGLEGATVTLEPIELHCR